MTPVRAQAMLKHSCKLKLRSSRPSCTLRLRSSYAQATLKLRSSYAQATLKLCSSCAQAMLKHPFVFHLCSSTCGHASSSYAEAHHRIQPTLKDMRALKISQAHCDASNLRSGTRACSTYAQSHVRVEVISSMTPTPWPRL